MSYENEKATSPLGEVALCGIVPSYRTLLEDFVLFIEFVEWLNGH